MGNILNSPDGFSESRYSYQTESDNTNYESRLEEGFNYSFEFLWLISIGISLCWNRQFKERADLFPVDSVTELNVTKKVIGDDCLRCFHTGKGF